jgi:hypothetical protein
VVQRPAPGPLRGSQGRSKAPIDLSWLYSNTLVDVR